MQLQSLLWLLAAISFAFCLPVPGNIFSGLTKRDPAFIQTLAFEGRKGHESGYVNDFAFFKSMFLDRPKPGPKPKLGSPFPSPQPIGSTENGPGGKCPWPLCSGPKCALHPAPGSNAPSTLSSILSTADNSSPALTRSTSLLSFIHAPDPPARVASPSPSLLEQVSYPAPIVPPEREPFPLAPLLESWESEPETNCFKRFWEWVKTLWRACFGGSCKA